MSNYDEVRKILKKTGLLFSESKILECKASALKLETKEMSLVVSSGNYELAEFVFSPNGTFLKIRPVEYEENNVQRQ